MDELGVFAKYWAAGAVKTRLAASYGKSGAAELYRVFLETTLRRFQEIGSARTVVYAPRSKEGAFADLAGPMWRREAQSDGDLGARLEGYFHSAIARGQERVVVVGSDCPTVPIDYLRRSFEELRRRRVVLGPSPDGGYYLIGAAGFVPPVFERIAWSTDSVWRETIERLDSAGIEYAVLPEWYDVDTAEDLKRMDDQLRTDEAMTQDSAYDALRGAIAERSSGSA